MKQIAYFGRKNHYGLRLYKLRKNKIDCVSGYLSRYININEVARRGSSTNIYINDLKSENVEQKSMKFTLQDQVKGINYLRWEATYAKGNIKVKTSEPVLSLDKVTVFTTYEYGAYDSDNRQDRYPKLEGTVSERPTEFSLPYEELEGYYKTARPELNVKFSHTEEIVDGEIPFRGTYVNNEIKNESKLKCSMDSAFICDIEYKTLIRSFFADGQYKRDDSQPIGYYADEYIEQCRAKYFYFVIEGTSIKREKTTFRFILDENGELVEPPEDFVPHYEKKLRDNPLLTAGAVYHSPDGDIPLYKWVAKNLLTKYKKTRYSLEFKKALTPLYLSSDFDPNNRLDRLIDSGDYISITDEYGDWMGGTLGERLEQSFFNGIKDKYGEAKAKEIAEHPLIYRVMNINTDVTNNVGYQTCGCIEVVDLDEIEEIFV